MLRLDLTMKFLEHRGGGGLGRDRMVVGFPTTNASSAFHH